MFDDDVIVGTVNLWETLEALFCFQTSDAIKISQLMRRMLGGS